MMFRDLSAFNEWIIIFPKGGVIMRVRKVFASVMLGLLLLLVGSIAGAGQGQVITPETREWAKKTVLDEQNVGATTAATNTLMVLYYSNRSNDAALDPLQKGLTLMLITDLSQVPNLQLVERVKLQALMEELKLGVSGLVVPETIPRAGKLVGARWVVGGDLTAPQPKRLAVLSRILEVPTAKVIGQPASEGMLEELLQIEKKMVFEIVELLRVQVTPEIAVALQKPASTSMVALDSLFKGVDASDHGDYQKAADFYSEALKADPNIIVARDALSQLRDMNYQPFSDRDTSAPMKRKLADTIRSTSGRTSLTNSLDVPDVSKSSLPLTPQTTPVNINVNFSGGAK
jgi:TolB-like protein